MEKTKKLIQFWGGVTLELILGLIFILVTENLNWLIPILILIAVTASLSFHITIPNDKNQANGENKKSWSYVTGIFPILTLLIIAILMVIPGCHDNIITNLFPTEIEMIEIDQVEQEPTTAISTSSTEYMPIPTSTELLLESTELTRQDNSYWFNEKCISTHWSAFNIITTVDEECIKFPSVNMEGQENGFSIVYAAEEPISFIIYNQLQDDISNISFKFRINKLKSSELNASSDFYFGFLPHDINNFYSFPSTFFNQIQFNGEFTIISGLDPIITNGLIHQNSNTYNYFNKSDFDITFKEAHVFQTDLNTTGNMWNVNIKNLSVKSNDFDRVELNTKGNYFAFGFRVPVGGEIDIHLFDWEVK